ncbi:MAG: lipoate-protein ligase B, partial [Proteobacteria bacterium]|nr:lipoate-protein ligase B [Pseudomonadota bacterium]
FNIRGETHPGRVGVWVTRKDKPLTGNGIIAEEKIAAIGIRLSKWVSYHGISINLDPNLEHFSGIVPCGISDRGVTSLTNLGISIRMEELDALLKENFYKIFEEKDV